MSSTFSGIQRLLAVIAVCCMLLMMVPAMPLVASAASFQFLTSGSLYVGGTQITNDNYELTAGEGGVTAGTVTYSEENGVPTLTLVGAKILTKNTDFPFFVDTKAYGINSTLDSLNIVIKNGQDENNNEIPCSIAAESTFDSAYAIYAKGKKLCFSGDGNVTIQSRESAIYAGTVEIKGGVKIDSTSEDETALNATNIIFDNCYDAIIELKGASNAINKRNTTLSVVDSEESDTSNLDKCFVVDAENANNEAFTAISLNSIVVSSATYKYIKIYHNHTKEEQYQITEKTHAQQCEICETVLVEADHEWEFEENTEAGHKHKCTTCLYSIEATVEDVSTLFDETTHWQQCQKCNKELSRVAHNFDEAKWKESDTDNNRHYRQCVGCEAKETQEHTYGSFEASTTEENMHYQRCSVCDKTVNNDYHTMIDAVDALRGLVKKCTVCSYVTENTVTIRVKTGLVYNGKDQELVEDISFSQVLTNKEPDPKATIAYAVTTEDTTEYSQLEFKERANAVAKNAGTYKVVAQIKIGDNATYATQTVTIGKKVLTVTPKSCKIPRGAVPKDTEVLLGVEGLVEGDRLEDGVLPKATLSDDFTTYEVGENLQATVVYANTNATDSQNYTLDLSNTSTTVTVYAVTATAEDYTVRVNEDTETVFNADAWYKGYLVISPAGEYIGISTSPNPIEARTELKVENLARFGDGSEITFYLMGDGVIADATLTYHLDNAAPNVTVTPVGNSKPYFNTFPDIEVVASDEQSGLAIIEGKTAAQYYIHDHGETSDEQAITNLTAEELALVSEESWTSFELTVDEESGEGTGTISLEGEYDAKRYVVYIRIEDAVGNVGYVNSEGIYIDKTAPIVESVTTDPNTVTNEDITVTIYGSDTFPGVQSVQYRKVVGADGVPSDWIDGDVEGVDTEQGTQLEFIIKAEDGNSGDYEIRVVDKAGNVSDPTTVTASFDLAGPVVSADAVIPNDWTSGDVVVSGTVSDDISGVSYMKYRKPGEEWPTEPNIAVTDGTYTFTLGAQDYEGAYEIAAWDAVGNMSMVQAVSVKMDISAPTIEDVTVTPSEWTNGSVIITGKVSDTGCGVAHMKYRRIGETEWPAEPNITIANNTFTFTFTIAEDQAFDGSFELCAWDAIGNETELQTATVSVKIDKTLPVIEDCIATQSDWTSEKIEIHGTVIDDLSGVETVKFRKKGTDTWLEDGVELTTDGFYTIGLDKQDYSGEYEVCAWDVAGNASEIQCVAVKMDKTVPVIVSGAALPATWTNGMVTVTGEVSDNLAGVATMKCRKAGETEWLDEPQISIDENGLYTFTIDAQSYNGNYELAAWDNAGNMAQVISVYVEMDTQIPGSVRMELETKPIDKLLSGITFGIYKAPTTVTVYAADTLSNETASGIQTLYASYEGTVGLFNDEVVTAPFEKTFSAELEKEVSFSIELPAAFNGTLKAWAVDEAGNTSNVLETAKHGDTQVKQVIVDGEAPQVKVVYTPQQSKVFAFRDEEKAIVETFAEASALYANDNITAKVTVTDNNFSADNTVITVLNEQNEAVVEGVTVSAWTSNGNVHTCTVTIAADGTYTLQVDCKDIAENTATVEAEDMTETVNGVYTSKTLIRDTVAPTIDNVKRTFAKKPLLSESMWTNNTITFTMDVEDALSGVDYLRYWKTAVDGSGQEMATKAENGQYTFTVGPQDYAGKYEICAWDLAGNTAFLETYDVLMDTTAPEVIGCETNNDKYSNAKVEILVKVQDPFNRNVASDIYQVQYKKEGAGNWSTNNVSFVQTDNETGIHEYCISLDKDSYAGNYLIRCLDKAGNTSEEEIVMVYMDFTSPEIESKVTIEKDTWTNEAVVIGGTAKDDLSGIVQMKYRKVGETEWLSDGIVLTEKEKIVEYTITLGRQDYEGDYQIAAWDNAGNMSEPKIVSVQMDITAPTITDPIADPSSWTNGTVTITGEVSDNLAGVATMKCRKVGETEWLDEPQIHVGESGRFTVTVAAQNYKGDYQLAAWDQAGNMSDIVNVLVQMDTHKPESLRMELQAEPLSKMIDTITFGIYQEPTTVTVYAADTLDTGVASGIQTIYVSYEGTSGFFSEEAVSGNYEEEIAVESDGEASFTFALPAAFNGVVKAWTEDKAGNGSDVLETTKHGDDVFEKLIVDGVAPQVKVEYTPEENKEFVHRSDVGVVVATFTEAATLYADGNITATVTVTDDNFSADNTAIIVCNQNGETVTQGVTISAWSTEGNVHTCIVTIAADGTYTLQVDCRDYAENQAIVTATDLTEAINKVYTSKTLIRDTGVPSIENVEVTYNAQLIETVDEKWTNGSITFTMDVSDGLSGIDYVKYRKTGADTWSAKERVTKTADGKYTFTIDPQNYKGTYEICAWDLAGNKHIVESATLHMDNTAPTMNGAPENAQEHSSKEEVVLTGTLTDTAGDELVSGIYQVQFKKTNSSEWSTEGVTFKESDKAAHTYDYTITIQKDNYNGNYQVRCIDNASNVSGVVAIGVQQDIEMPKIVDGRVSVSNTDWTNGAVTVTGAVTDIEIVPETYNSGIAYVEYHRVDLPERYWTKVDSENVTTVRSVQDGENTVVLEAEFTFTIPAQDYNGEYEIRVYDNAENVSEVVKFSVKMDTTAPEVESTTVTSHDKAYTSDMWTNDDIIVNVNVTDTAAPAAPKSNSGVVAVKYKLGANGEEQTASAISVGTLYRFAIPAQNYSGDVYIWCVDAAGNANNSQEALEKNKLTVHMDITSPSSPTITFEQSVMSVLAEKVTFGFFKADVTAVITSSDPAVDNVHSGVQQIEYYFDGVKSEYDSTEADVQGVEVTDREIRVQIKAQFRGTFRAHAVDKAGNRSETTTTSTIQDTAVDTLVVDSLAPQIQIAYESVKSDTAPFHFVDVNMNTVDSFDKAERVYCRDSVQVTLTVTEGNFVDDQVRVKVLKNGKDMDSKTAPVLSAWKHEGSIHTASLTLEGDGDYEVQVSYKDYATNQAAITSQDGQTQTESYSSKTIVIDTTAPEIESVKYDNNKVINTIGGREYYDDVRTATIVIKDHNFRADEVELFVKAQNVVGANLLPTVGGTDNTQSYYELGMDRTRWTAYESGSFRSKDDRYTLVVAYATDANYTFDINYEDLAGNVVKSDYAAEQFTVDMTDPTDLTIDYSAGILEMLLNQVTFGFYNAKMTVTISAQDSVSGVNRFVYSYTKAYGVSSVNAQMIDQAIASSQITYNGDRATASFTIPKDALDRTSQFNGTVSFTAYDRSENESKKADARNVVVDNIRPEIQVSYNDPTKTAGDISYYDGNVSGTIRITEANFYSEDVRVNVTKNGESVPVSVAWSDESVDSHIGTFTLTEDGDYIVDVSYSDRSNNAMQEYRSNQLTIDTKLPTIRVSNIKHASANADEVFGFTVTANDTNLDSSTFKVTLNAVVLNENGTFKEIEVPVGDMATVIDGQTYSFTVENLTEDAIYTMNCTVSDLAGHVYSKMVLDDGEEYETVEFSVNRNGSVFSLDAYTLSLARKYFIHELTGNVVIIETNADPLSNYQVTLNGNNLRKGTDYTVIEEGGNGKWMKYTYSINKDLFAEEGEYQLFVSSTDKLGVNAFSDVKGATVHFVIDRTAPVLAFSGLEDGGRYQTESQTVTVAPTDDGGALYSLIVQLVDNDGNVIKELLDLEDEDLEDALEEGDGKIQFVIPSGLYQNIRVICTDATQGVDGEGNVYDYTFTNVSVTTNLFMIFWANKPLRWGVIIGLALLISSLIFFLIFFKRRKKKEEETDAMDSQPLPAEAVAVAGAAEETVQLEQPPVERQ